MSSNPLTVPGSLPWSDWTAPDVITATTKLVPPPTQLGTILKNFLVFAGIGGALGAAAGVALLGTGVAGAFVPALLTANLSAMFGVLEGVFLSGRDERRYADALERQAAAIAASAPPAKKKQQRRVVVQPPAAEPRAPAGRTRESWKS
jgi:hypothetical protein